LYERTHAHTLKIEIFSIIVRAYLAYYLNIIIYRYLETHIMRD